MNGKIVRTIAWGIVMPVIMVGMAWHAQAQNAKASYPSMAPIDKYLIADRNVETALARSAAPEAISKDAEVLILGLHGYETAIKGKNGFVCLVERSWMSGFDSPEFWNPKLRGPVCFNPPAARSVLPLTFKRTELVLAGLSKAQIIDGIKTFDKRELPPLEPGGMAYMLSKDGYLSDADGHWHPHLMIHVPKVAGASWGANLPGSPVVFDDREVPEPQTIFMVPVSHWSDGSTAAAH